jgi:hypothetical protein
LRLCVICGKRITPGLICDMCLVKIHVECIITGEPLQKATERHNLCYKAVSARIRRLRRKGKYIKLFFTVVEELKHDYQELG